MAKKEFYSRIKIAGMLSFVPVILASGPFLGYISGDYLVKKFKLPAYLTIILIALGFLSSIIEVVKIIRRARKIAG